MPPTRLAGRRPARHDMAVDGGPEPVDLPGEMEIGWQIGSGVRLVRQPGRGRSAYELSGVVLVPTTNEETWTNFFTIGSPPPREPLWGSRQRRRHPEILPNWPGVISISVTGP